MLDSQTLEAFIDRTLTQYVPGAFQSDGLRCMSPDGMYDAFENDFVDPSDVFDDDDSGPANDADAVADSIQSIYRGNDGWAIPDEVA